MKATALILSGGKGLRFGSDLPKQYIEICGQPVLGHTLQAFEQSTVDEIIIVAARDYIEHCRNIAADCGCSKLRAVVSGGTERYDSVLQGLRYLFQNGHGHDASRMPAAENRETNCLPDPEESMVLIHDGARPCIRPEVINQIITDCRQYGAAIAGTPCTDTIKIVDADGCITETTDRTLTWAAQTPQAFLLSSIYEAYEKVIGNGLPEKPLPESEFCTEKQIPPITDDAMVYQLAFPERKVRMVPAGRENIKITGASDLALAAQYLQK